MRSCKEITRLVSEAQERELGFWEKVELRFHTIICNSCRRFEKQMGLLREASRRFSRGDHQ